MVTNVEFCNNWPILLLWPRRAPRKVVFLGQPLRINDGRNYTGKLTAQKKISSTPRDCSTNFLAQSPQSDRSWVILAEWHPLRSFEDKARLSSRTTTRICVWGAAIVERCDASDKNTLPDVTPWSLFVESHFESNITRNTKNREHS